MKKLLSISLAFALMLSLALSAGLAAAEPPQKPITPGDLKQLTLIHYAKPDNPGKPDKPGKPDDPEPPPVENGYYELLGLYLPGEATYYINTTGAPDGALGEIIASFETWDDVTGADLFSSDGLTTVSGIKLDTQNTVSWVKIVPRNIIAMVAIWYEDDGNPETLDPIVEFDMVFNALHKWGIDLDGEGEGYELEKAFDVRNIATHEAGHVVGLADLYEEQYREITMYGYGSLGETLKISLEDGDIAGVQEIYGIA